MGWWYPLTGRGSSMFFSESEALLSYRRYHWVEIGRPFTLDAHGRSFMVRETESGIAIHLFGIH